MDNTKTVSKGGVGFCGLLTIVFIVLKLCNVIDWSWWWVISPIWIELVIAVVFIIAFSIYQYIRIR